MSNRPEFYDWQNKMLSRLDEFDGETFESPDKPEGSPTYSFNLLLIMSRILNNWPNESRIGYLRRWRTLGPNPRYFQTRFSDKSSPFPERIIRISEVLLPNFQDVFRFAIDASLKTPNVPSFNFFDEIFDGKKRKLKLNSEKKMPTPWEASVLLFLAYGFNDKDKDDTKN